MAKTATYDDAKLLLRLYDLRREARMREARKWFVKAFHAVTADEFNALCPVGSHENASLRMVVTYWDMVASFITAGVLNRDLFFQSGRELLLVWERLRALHYAVKPLRHGDPQFLDLERVGEAYAGWMKARSREGYEAFARRIGGTRSSGGDRVVSWPGGEETTIGRAATYEDANLILDLYEQRRDETLRRARHWFMHNFHVDTLAEFQSLCPPGSEHEIYGRMMVTYWEMVASLLSAGVLEPRLFYKSGRELLFVWERIRDIAPGIRTVNQDPFLWHNLETQAQAYIDWLNTEAPGAAEAWAKMVRALGRKVEAAAG
jgi:hypothetical protein